jgi:hypothetical protein
VLLSFAGPYARLWPWAQARGWVSRSGRRSGRVGRSILAILRPYLGGALRDFYLYSENICFFDFWPYMAFGGIWQHGNTPTGCGSDLFTILKILKNDRTSRSVNNFLVALPPRPLKQVGLRPLRKTGFRLEVSHVEEFGGRLIVGVWRNGVFPPIMV